MTYNSCLNASVVWWKHIYFITYAGSVPRRDDPVVYTDIAAAGSSSDGEYGTKPPPAPAGADKQASPAPPAGAVPVHL